MVNRFIWGITVSTVRGVLWVESVVVVIDSCVRGPPLKNGALVCSGEFVDVVTFLGVRHLPVNRSTSFTRGPSVHPFFL